MSKAVFLKIFVFLNFIFPLSLLGQSFPVDAATGKIYYAEEVLVKDGPQLELYHRAKAWFAKAGKTKNTIQVDDLPNGVLIAKNYLLLSVKNQEKNQTYQLWYTLKIEMEDDRYWYSLTDFQLQPFNKPGATKSGTSTTPRQALEKIVLPQKAQTTPDYKLKSPAHQGIQNLIQEIKKAMD